MKRIKWALIVVVLLIVIGGLILWLNLDLIIKRTVESQGTSQLHVPTTLGAVDLSIFSGHLGLTNLGIGSPQGFTAPQLFNLGGASVDVALSQLRQEPIHIANITIDKPMLVIEQQGGKLNVKALMDQMAPSSPASPSEPASPQPPAQAGPAAAGQTVKLIIDQLDLNNAMVTVRPGLPGMTQEMTIPIPSFSLKNIGNADGAENGAAIKDVISTIITSMTKQAANSDKLPPEVRQLLSLNMGDLSQQAGAAVKSELNKATGDLSKKLPGSVGNLLNGLGGNQGK